jgi:hypothetical protein
MAPLGSGYGLFSGIGNAIPPGPSFIPPVFSEPISLTYDDSHLWVADKGHALLQKVDVTSPTPGVILALDLSVFEVNSIREVKYDPVSGYVFACCNTIGDVDVAIHLVAIINKTTNAVVGTIVLGDFARSTITDGIGNFFVAESPRGNDSSTLHKFSIANTVSAFPSNGTPIASYPYIYHIENLTFGNGFIWAGNGTLNYLHPPVLNVYQAGYGGVLLRINPSTGALVTARADRNRYVWNAFYAFGSIWSGVTGPDLQKWDPNTFSPQLSPGNPLYVIHPVDTPASFNAGMMTGEFTIQGGEVWMGCNISDKRIHRVNPNTNVITVMRHNNSFVNHDSLVFDGTHVWGTSRFGNMSSAPNGIHRFTTDAGAELPDYRIYNGSNGTSWFAGISPKFGPHAGGTSVTLKGGGFSTATGVVFNYSPGGGGNIPATSFVLVDDNTITCTSPARAGSFNANNPFAHVTIQRSDGDLLWSSAFRYQ